MRYIHTQYKKGFALFVAIGVVSIVLLVSVALTNIALKQTQIASSGRESQKAFYAADNGIECALYWETINPTPLGTPGESPFKQSSTQQISCGSGLVTVGGALTSTFTLPFDDGTCVEVEVTKNAAQTQTSIDARGRDSCDVANTRRVERGVRIQYGS